MDKFYPCDCRKYVSYPMVSITEMYREDNYVSSIPILEVERLPIFIHQIQDDSKIHRIIRLKPGIHYAVNAVNDPDYLIRNIRRILWECLIKQPCSPAPAGIRNGVLETQQIIKSYFALVQQDQLYDLGINPIIFRHGAPTIWGHLFVAQNGTIQRMVKYPDHYGTTLSEEYQDNVNPALFEFME